MWSIILKGGAIIHGTCKFPNYAEQQTLNYWPRLHNLALIKLFGLLQVESGLPQPGLWLADKNGEKATVRVSLNIDKNKKGAYRINLSVHNTADNDYPIYQSYW